jgi:hypothetical protein
MRGARLMKKRWRDHEPRVRPVKGGVLIDELDEYAGHVTGMPPADFNELLAQTMKLQKLATDVVDPDGCANHSPEERVRIADRARDMLLLAAFAYTQMREDGKSQHPMAFIQRCKQVARWCERPIREMTPLSVLENKARELARQIAMRLFRGEGFVLLLFNEGTTDGHVTWISSAARRDTLALIKELTSKIDEDQGSLS